MNQEIYAMRMEDNVDDKLVILDFIEEKRNKKYNILDFGCGSGSIFESTYSTFPNAHIVGFDRSEYMIQRAQENYPNGTFFSKFEDLDLFTRQNSLFDYIILNSVLHEIYSYQGGFVAVVELVEALSKYLTKSGKFIVRDGILDLESKAEINRLEKYKLKKPIEAENFLKEYTYLSPFPNHLLIKDNNIIGQWYEVREFLNKYTWGFDSLYREAKEIVNFASLEMYQELFQKSGLKINRKLLVKQEEFFTYLDQIIEIGDTRWNTKIVFSASKDL